MTAVSGTTPEVWIDHACTRCGGYGVLCTSSDGNRFKRRCYDCGGDGHVMERLVPWSAWTPDPGTLDMLRAMSGDAHVEASDA